MLGLLTGAMMAQSTQQMMQSTALSMAQSAQQHQQSMLNSQLEHQRSLNNNWEKQGRDALGDAMKNQSNTTNELGQKAAAG